MKDNPIFTNFKIVSFRDWANKHRLCPKEQLINSEDGRTFRFLKCLKHNELYYMGEIIGDRL